MYPRMPSCIGVREIIFVILLAARIAHGYNLRPDTDSSFEIATKESVL